MKQLSQRQEQILHLLLQSDFLATRDIVKALARVSRITIIRDLAELVDEELVNRQGKGRSVVYAIIPKHPWLKLIDVSRYFTAGPDVRTIIDEPLDWQNWPDDKGLLEKSEINTIDDLTRQYRHNISRLSDNLITKEFERVTVEFSWKSSRIEGNTYSLLDTEQLLKGGVEAAGHTSEEARMILNHKQAMSYIRHQASDYRRLTVIKITDIHSLVVRDMNIELGLRSRPVGIIGTRYKPFDNLYQVREALESLVKLINQLNNPLEQALVAVVGLSYIQPFIDGNKRTGRLISNAILLAHNLCPLSYRSVDEVEYKKAIILFYEQHSLWYFKQLFIDQYRFAVKTYFQ